jgi:hypothetical protein
MIVKTIQAEGAVVHIDDDVLRTLTPEQIEANRRQARAAAWGIAYRAMERGEVEGLTPEEWVRRYGDGGTDCRGPAGLAMTGGGSAPHPSPAATPSPQGEGFTGERSGVNG